MENIVALKDLRLNMDTYIRKVNTGQSFIVLKKNKPIFKLEPINAGSWEEVIDFTKIRKGGVSIDEILKRL